MAVGQTEWVASVSTSQLEKQEGLKENKGAPEVQILKAIWAPNNLQDLGLQCVFSYHRNWGQQIHSASHCTQSEDVTLSWQLAVQPAHEV